MDDVAATATRVSLRNSLLFINDTSCCGINVDMKTENPCMCILSGSDPFRSSMEIVLVSISRKREEVSALHSVDARRQRRKNRAKR